MAVALNRKWDYLTPEEYLEIERAAETKSEYFDGEMFAMAGASSRHTFIVGNLSGLLYNCRRRKGCRVVTQDLRVLVSPTGLYTYPDVVVICGKPEYADGNFDILLNPTLIIEVLSRSTEAYDREGKFAHYKQIESLQEYVLVAQSRPQVETFVRQESGVWLPDVVTGLESTVTVRLKSIGCELALADIYEDIEFGDQDEPTIRMVRPGEA